MGLFEKVEIEVDIKSQPSRFYDIFHATPYLLPTISSPKIQVCELTQGDWGKHGSILYWNFVHDGKAYAVKDVIEGVDKENYSITFTTIEGDLVELYKSFKTTLQVFQKGEKNVVRWIFECEKLREEDDPYLNIFLNYHADLSKEIDGYLMKTDQILPEKVPAKDSQA